MSRLTMTIALAMNEAPPPPNGLIPTTSLGNSAREGAEGLGEGGGRGLEYRAPGFVAGKCD